MQIILDMAENNNKMKIKLPKVLNKATGRESSAPYQFLSQSGMQGLQVTSSQLREGVWISFKPFLLRRTLSRTRNQAWTLISQVGPAMTLTRMLVSVCLLIACTDKTNNSIIGVVSKSRQYHFLQLQVTHFVLYCV